MSEQYHLFLIEDEEDIALLIQRSLERAGHRITRCRTAADALIVLEHGKYDLVIVDQCLPDLSGLELLQRLANENVSLPALMVTAHGDEELATRSMQAGALDYLVKDDALTFLAELPRRVEESITQHTLIQNNRLLVQSLESAGDGIMITDLQGTILNVNRALVEMTGYSREELLGQKPSLLKSHQHPPELYADLWKTVLSRATWKGELINRRKDGSPLEVSLTISPIVDGQGRLTHFVGIQRDISEHKLLQQQLLQAQKMQSIGTLAGGVAHEFNNLLAGISGYASLGLCEENVPAPLDEFLQYIVDLSERASLLTQQMLAFARKPALTRKTTRINDLVESTANLIRRTLHMEVNLDLQQADESSLGLMVEADQNQLQQTLINLALNARDAIYEKRGGEHSSEEVISISMKVEGVDYSQEQSAFPQSIPPGCYVCISVEDQGSGMIPKVMEQAFDPFYTTKEVGKGTGLGLSVVHGIVQAHQGYLSVESARGAGTKMMIYLPQSQQREPVAPPATQSVHVIEPEAARRASILVIDDEQSVLDVVSRFLEIAGHRVHGVKSGVEGIRHVETEESTDLVILDLLMPRESSLVTFQKIREVREDLPVLLCTGTVAETDAKRILEEGASGLLQKPFRMTELWHAVKQALETGKA